MLGHKWEQAEGTIVEATAGPSHGHGLNAALHPEHRYVIEVRKPTGEVIRGTVSEKSRLAHAVGQTVRVEVHTKNNEIRLDPNARADTVRGMLNMAEQMRSAAGGMSVGGVAGTAGLAGALGAMGPGVHMTGQGVHMTGPGVHIMGTGGQEIPIGAAQGAEVNELAQAMMSGDPAARQAAIARLRQIKADAGQQAAGGVGSPGGSGTAGPASSAPAASTFDPIGQASTAGTFGEPEPQASYGQPATPSPYGQVSPPSPYGQVSPPTSGAPSSFGSFGDSGTEGSKEQRIAKLQQLLDKGILTESEFQNQRQQILSGG